MLCEPVCIQAQARGVSHSVLLLSPPHSAMHHSRSVPRDSNSRTPPRNTTADRKHKRRDSNNADSKNRSGGSQNYDNAADNTDNTHRRERHNKGHNTDASASSEGGTSAPQSKANTRRQASDHLPEASEPESGSDPDFSTDMNARVEHVERYLSRAQNMVAMQLKWTRARAIWNYAHNNGMLMTEGSRSDIRDIDSYCGFGKHTGGATKLTFRTPAAVRRFTSIFKANPFDRYSRYSIYSQIVIAPKWLCISMADKYSVDIRLTVPMLLTLSL